MTDYEYPFNLLFLAAAYSEAGDMENAINWHEKCLEVSPPGLRKLLEPGLAQYRADTSFSRWTDDAKGLREVFESVCTR